MTKQLESAVVHAAVTHTHLEELLDDAKRATTTLAMGAVVTFEGVVRDHDDGRSVVALSYSHHPSATDVITQIAHEVSAKYPGTRVWAAHRVGDLHVGDMAFLVVVAAAHRIQAFSACTELVDEVKARLPIWKEQTMTDGDTQWVGTE
ncbi:MAG: molybdenum cofactor biosynthesis protein MoaE [Actinomycetaceae bacterium]|nr:molybdenum cofactor biosynthesis protein MoaE [Actinomycetaceae bacterium]